MPAPVRSLGWWPLKLIALAMLLASGAHLNAQPVGRTAAVTLPVGATIDQVIAEVARVINGVVVADVATREARLSKNLREAPLAQALEQISADFDRLWLMRGKTIVLQLRRWRPDEPRALETDELQRVASDMARLVQLAPDVSLQDFHGARVRFVASTTPEQRRRMQREGLRFQALSPDQQRLITEINLTYAYEDVANSIREIGRLCAALDECEVTACHERSSVARADDTDAGANRYLQVTMPDRSSPDGRLVHPLALANPNRVAAAKASAARGLPAEGQVIDSEAPPRRGPPARISIRRISLEDFSRQWRRAIGTPLRVPAYAAARQFWICSAGATRTEAAQALADLWGWETSTLSDARRLGPPSVPAATSPLELHSAMRLAIPPELRHTARAWIQRDDLRRRTLELSAIHDRLGERAGIDRPAPMRSLPDPQRRAVLAALVESAVAEWFGHKGDHPEPRSWIANPEDILIALDGPVAEKDGDREYRIWVGSASRGGRWSWPARTFVKVTRVEGPAR